MDPFEKLTSKLSELFELEKADLDFGIHRIIKARQKHIRIFLGIDESPAEDPSAPTLKKIVQREMGELNIVELERQLDAASSKIKSDYGKLAFNDHGSLTDGPAKESADGQTWLNLKEQIESGAEQSNAQLEAEIYSHLTEFFSRYYDEADFLSKRRIKAGDTPYAVPYSGEEVMLHWANKDQYYIKSSMDLKDYTFTIKTGTGSEKRVQFKCERQDPVLNNNNAKREFHLDEEAEIEVTENSLLIPFHFKIVEKTRTQPETKKWIEDLLTKLPPEWQNALLHTPAEAKNNLITRHLANYTRKNEADFFIHKHLGKFLRSELDFYIKNEVMHLDDIDAKSTDYLATRVRLIKALRTIARHIITFLAQLENFQKKLWLKKKYVTETHYCITLDRIFAMDKGDVLIATVLDHLDTKSRRYDGKMRSQHDEWIKLYAIDGLEDYPKNGKLTTDFLRAHDKLMLDTVFFPQSFKWSLLGEIDDLDASLDGLIIHSENFQALNLLQERYRERVKCVYIDPPYNTGSDGFPYKDAYPHSSWATMIENRIAELFSILSPEGHLFASIDENEVSRLVELLRRIAGDTNYLGELIWQGSSKNDQKYISFSHEYLLIAFRDKSLCDADSRRWLERKPGLDEIYGAFQKIKKEFQDDYPSQTSALKVWFSGLKDSHPAKQWSHYCRAERRGIYFPDNISKPAKGYFYDIPHPVTGRICKPPKGGYRFVWETMKQQLSDDLIHFGPDETTVPCRKSFLHETEFSSPRSVIYQDGRAATKRIHGLFGSKDVFANPKDHNVLARLFAISCQKTSVFMDPFAGSGTIADSLLQLNREDTGSRKYILVEMGDHFDTVLKPRIQKVVYSKDWKEGKPTAPETGISHAFKYLRLESYEDALNNLDLGTDRAPDLLGLGDQVREDYLFTYLLDVETRGHLINLNHFRDPWGCQLKIHDPHTGKSEPRAIDLVETFHYLLGITVREVRVQGEGSGFLTIEGETPEGETILIIWRKLAGESDWPSTTNSDLKKFVTGKLRINPADTEYHAIYVNGDHTLTDPQSKIHCIEEVFYERMFENTGNPED